MEFKLSQRVQRIKPSPTLAVTARAAEMRAAGHDVIGLGAGEPDFDTPDHIKQAAVEAIREGFTKYTPVGGIPGLRKAIVSKLERENGLSYGTDQILVSTGAKHSLFNVMQALLDEGDEVVIPAPYWVSYPDMALLAGARPVTIESDYDSELKITPQALAAALTERTRLVILNSPSNPSGKAYTRAELAALGEVIERHPNVVVVTDDIYEHILWSGEPFSNILNATPGLYGRTVVINGVSKAYSMTGWRIGYAAGPAPLIKAMTKIQGQATSSATSISQRAAEAALNGGNGCVTEMVQAFKQRHDFVYKTLNEIPGIRCLPSDGTFYAFPDVSGVINRLEDISDDTALAEMLIEKAGVAMVPGSAFGTPGHLRLSFATSMENLEQALERTARAVT